MAVTESERPRIHLTRNAIRTLCGKDVFKVVRSTIHDDEFLRVRPRCVPCDRARKKTLIEKRRSEM